MIGFANFFSRISICARPAAARTSQDQRIRKVVVRGWIGIVPVQVKEAWHSRAQLDAVARAGDCIEPQCAVIADARIIAITIAIEVHCHRTEDVDGVAGVSAQ